MSTIAYSIDSISYDSRTSDKNRIVTDKAVKAKSIGDLTVFAVGPVCDIELIYAYISKYGSKILDVLEVHNLPRKLQVELFVLYNREVFYVEVSDILKVEHLKHQWAIGSGSNWAIAAMDFGCSSFDAVHYATKKDKSSGGKIHTVKCDVISDD
jgi:hypothetical protein